MQKLNIRFATIPTHVSDCAAAVGMHSMESSTQDVPDRPTIPSGKTSKAWLYFNTQSSTSQKAVCTIWKREVACLGGTTNLLAHLQKWHGDIYNRICPNSSQGNLDKYITNNKVVKLPYHSNRSKSLTSAICEFVMRDLRPISAVDDTGFLHLMHFADPKYSVPCRSTIKRKIDHLYSQETCRVKTYINSVKFLTCITDMWTSRSSDGYISLTCHFINKGWTMSL